MSSHHVVRDNQEFALIIADGEPCDMALMDELYAWSPYVVVLDGAYPSIQALNLNADVWLGDFDAIAPDGELPKADNVEVVRRWDQNKTDFEKGIEYCIEKGFTDIKIIWATGWRPDHTLANITNLVKYRHQATLTILDNFARIYPLPNAFEKWYPKGKVLSLFPIGEASGIVTQGLKYELNNENLKLADRIGSSNEAAMDGFVRISYKTGDLVMMEIVGIDG
ncbi:MAG: thiamine diphosphokinase [Bacteroidia bacterium]